MIDWLSKYMENLLWINFDLKLIKPLTTAALLQCILEHMSFSISSFHSTSVLTCSGLIHADLLQTDIFGENCLVHSGVCSYFANRPSCLVWAKWCHLLGAAQLKKKMTLRLQRH